MAGDFSIDPKSLDAAALRMQRCSDDFAAAVQKLSGRVLGAGSPWGNDPMGTIFAEAYTECTGAGLQALAHLGDVMGSVAVGLAKMAESTRVTDQSASTAMDGMLNG